MRRFTHSLYLGAACGLVLLFSAPVMAQEALLPTVKSTGVAEVDVSPEFVDFWVIGEFKEASIAESLNAALKLEAGLAQALKAENITPKEVANHSPTLPLLSEQDNGREGENTVFTRTRLRYSMADLLYNEKGLELFGVLCDKLKTAAAGLELTLTGPAFGVNGTEQVEQQAIAAAIENAYPAAEAAASIMSLHVGSVSAVEIEAVVWTGGLQNRFIRDSFETNPSAYGEIERLVCKARVQVTYVAI